ncbi:MAG: hypothetical protein E7058_04220, partial [Lentisphaerae bacterium]|nr:hypothetical protein [Lentisphaerota bacterium]
MSKKSAKISFPFGKNRQQRDVLPRSGCRRMQLFQHCIFSLLFKTDFSLKEQDGAAGCGKTRPSVFVSLRRDESLRWGSDIPSQRSPLFLKEKGGAGERENFFSRPRGGLRKNSPFSLLGLGQYITQRVPLFLKEKGGAGERENFFSREKKFSLSPAHSHFTLIELLV